MARFTTVVVSLGFASVGFAAAWQPLARPVSSHCARTSVCEMKGKRSRGMPKKATMQPGQMVNTGLKSRMAKRDFDERKEWVPVCRLDDIPAVGATKAVGAGKEPGRMGPTGWTEGSEYIWSVVRAEPSMDDETKQASETVYAVDGSCRCCQFPMTAASYSHTNGRDELTCSCCGTKYALDNGEVLDWLPKSNPIQWATALRVGDVKPSAMASLPTRVSKSGRVYLRLPDNTML